MNDQQKSRKTLRTSEIFILMIILFTGLFLRILHLVYITKSPDFTAPMADAAYHDYWARGLADGDWSPPEGMTDPQIRSSPYFRPPGYPYFLAFVYMLSGSSRLAAGIVQMTMGLVNCVLAYILGRSLFGRATGLILAGFMSIYWIFIFFEGELLAPVLVIFFALLLMNVLQLWTEKFTYARSIIAGIVFGLLVVIRPNVLLFVPLILTWAWWLARRRNDGRRLSIAASGFLASAAIVIAPVTLRNYLAANDFVLISSNAGINLYAGNNEQANCFSPNITGLKEMAGLENWTCFSYPEVVHRVEIISGKPVKYSEVSSYFAGKALRYIHKNPLKTLKLLLRKTLLFWGPAEISNNKEIFCEKKMSAALRYIPGFPVVLSSALLGLLQLISNLKVWRIKKEPLNPKAEKQFEVSLLILLFICAYFVSYLPFFITARFRVPIIPFLLLFGAYGVYEIARNARNRHFRKAVCWTITWVALWAVVSRPFAPYKPNWARWYYCRGQAYLNNNQIDRAVKEYRKAIKIEPNAFWAHSFLADALMQQGKLEEAAQHYYSVLNIKPDFLKAQFNLAGILFQQGNIDDAIRYWTHVIQLNPYYAEAHSNLAAAFYKQGKNDEAIAHWLEAAKQRPDWAEVQNSLGTALYRQGKNKEAARYWAEAIRLKPDWPEPYNNLAWLLATTEDENLHNPAEAVRLAERACELTNYNHPEMLDTLAAAYTSAGRLSDAEKTAEKAKKSASGPGQEKRITDVNKHPKLYKLD